MPERYSLARAEVMKRFAQSAAEEWRAEKETRAVLEDFNNRLAQRVTIWAWPTIGAALISKHFWMSIVCESCDGGSILDLRMKPRDPETPILAVLQDVKCPRCNGRGRPRISAVKQGNERVGSEGAF